MKEKPETIEEEWDILYRDYPEVYERWMQYEKTPDIMELLNRQFRFVGKDIVDVGSGTGISTSKLARHASTVVGIEIEPSMIAIAQTKAREAGSSNVTFMLGDAENIHLSGSSMDMAIAVFIAGGDTRVVANEMERVVKHSGYAIRVDVAPGWYGGEFNPIITGAPRIETPRSGSPNEILPSLGYQVMDVSMDQQYGTVEDMVATYGFIHGKAVIDHIRRNGITSMKWKVRVHYKIVEKRPRDD